MEILTNLKAVFYYLVSAPIINLVIYLMFVHHKKKKKQAKNQHTGLKFRHSNYGNVNHIK